MSTVLIPGFYSTVFMNSSNVMPFVSDFSVEQTEAGYRQFSIVFRAWHFISRASRWDIYSSFSATNLQEYAWIRNGFMAEDGGMVGVVKLGTPATFTVNGYDYLWKIQRRRPRTSLILVKGHGREARRNLAIALEQNTGLGRYEVIGGVYNLHVAIRKLATKAGIGAQIDIRSYPFTWLVIDSGTSYWDAIANLVAPFASHVCYSRWRNMLVIADSPPRFMGPVGAITIPSGLIDELDIIPVVTSRPSRIRLRFNRWR